MIWFTADEHYEHANVIRFCNRPYKDIDEMREALIANHNALVKPGDLVYHLGDMFWKSCTEELALSIMDRLEGNHYYIYGNHDELIDRSPRLRSRFHWLKHIARIRSGSVQVQDQTFTYPRIVLCHYAMLVWEGSHRGDWQLYGHSHGELSSSILDNTVSGRLQSFDVGVDCWGQRPISIIDVIKIMQSKQAASGLTWHECPKCQHRFYNYSKYDEICSKCLEIMEIKDETEHDDYGVE